MPDRLREIDRESREYLELHLTSKDPGDAATLTDADLSVHFGDLLPIPEWHPVDLYVGGVAKILVGPGTDVGQLLVGDAVVRVRIGSDPEAPVIRAGRLYVTAG